MDQAEQLRNIIKRQNMPDKLARVVTVTSGKGGVGKSNLSVNLGIQLCRMGKRVIILDADFGLANVEVMLGIRPKYNLADIIYGSKGLQEIITKGPENLMFISGGSGIQELSNITKGQISFLNEKLYELDEIADIIIIDTGAGITDSVLEFVMASSEVLLVITPEPTSITDAYALLKVLNKREDFNSDMTSIKMIANRINSEEEGRSLYNKMNLVVEKFLTIKLEYLGGIPQDSNVSRSVMQQKPYSVLYPNSPSSRAVSVLAKALCDDVPAGNLGQRGIAHFFSSLLHRKTSK
ncbi:MinD/ParA family protein [Anaerocolumna xylanovorans]|uniref:Flagellar biosynthesis protein FlhG n=1 Tax=Anaerocolumna xylanovorans DSM 12503 TaxID=1121345 RepID=A0A1M7YB57_9FIRM|nr:MinD/ParA family protein [Anaerocolumna xylanovorans]SHO49842.1 flagellar biosynthesis protein FlhG [Anaerocolumna xylanovorans DSM 12503]